MGSFVQLFFILSGFSMCCGYYEKIKNNQISLYKFYSRRYVKILPFFTLLVLMDLAVSMVFDGGIGTSNIYEAFADLTLLFGFLPASDITVIGVGWTLGVIFGFYILFPFFVYLLWNKKRAWLSLVITTALNYVCTVYFTVDGEAVECNVLRYLCYFIAGGIIYLYRDEISGLIKNGLLGILITLLGFALVFMVENPVSGLVGPLIGTLKRMLGYTFMVAGALCAETKLWSNPVSKFISGVSLEIYLAHMMVFRVIEKLGMTTIAGGSVVSYVIACIGTIGGALIFAIVYQYAEGIIKKKVVKA